jgi:hypothetical protein
VFLVEEKGEVKKNAVGIQAHDEDPKEDRRSKTTLEGAT